MILQRLSRITPDSFLGSVVRAPLRLVPKHLVVSVRSGINKGMRWITGASIHGCWLGYYEYEKQALVATLIRPGMMVFDIGANAGFYTLAFSRLAGESGHVWAFEPLAENAANVLRHIQLNRLCNVTVVQAIVGDKPGITGFEIGANNSIGKALTTRSNYLVPTICLDALIASDVIPAPDLVKIDVEGAESDVLKGAQLLLAWRTTSFLIALHSRAEQKACLSMLMQFGYEPLNLRGEHVAPDGDFVDEIFARAPGDTRPKG